jgi:hypothetical protein
MTQRIRFGSTRDIFTYDYRMVLYVHVLVRTSHIAFLLQYFYVKML